MKLFESHQPLLLLGIRRAGLVSTSNAYSATLTGVTIIVANRAVTNATIRRPGHTPSGDPA